MLRWRWRQSLWRKLKAVLVWTTIPWWNSLKFMCYGSDTVCDIPKLVQNQQRFIHISDFQGSAHYNDIRSKNVEWVFPCKDCQLLTRFHWRIWRSSIINVSLLNDSFRMTPWVQQSYTLYFNFIMTPYGPSMFQLSSLLDFKPILQPKPTHTKKTIITLIYTDCIYEWEFSAMKLSSTQTLSNCCLGY